MSKLTVFDPEPMPTADDLFQKLNGETDLSKGCCQITMPEEDIPKKVGSYKYLKMQFGMIKSAARLTAPCRNY